MVRMKKVRSKLLERDLELLPLAPRWATTDRAPSDEARRVIVAAQAAAIRKGKRR